MKKSPEEYFLEKDFLPESGAVEGDFTPAEKAFLMKYLGMDEAALAKKLGVAPEEARRIIDEAPPIDEILAEEPSLAERLRDEAEMQMVSFFVEDQEFTVPIIVVQEVLKAMPVTKLPTAPNFIAGMINLRGKVLPLVRLGSLLGVAPAKSGRGGADQFIIVVKHKGLQVGLMISTVHTMYRVAQDMVEWGIESHLGVAAEYVAGLMKQGERLVGIVSVDKIVESVLKS